MDEECGTISTINHVNFHSLKLKFSIFTILSRRFFFILFCVAIMTMISARRDDIRMVKHANVCSTLDTCVTTNSHEECPKESYSKKKRDEHKKKKILK